MNDLDLFCYFLLCALVVSRHYSATTDNLTDLEQNFLKNKQHLRVYGFISTKTDNQSPYKDCLHVTLSCPAS